MTRPLRGSHPPDSLFRLGRASRHGSVHAAGCKGDTGRTPPGMVPRVSLPVQRSGFRPDESDDETDVLYPGRVPDFGGIRNDPPKRQPDPR